jgi:hypothetical protein
VFSFLKLCTSFDVKAAQAPDGIDPRRGGLGADFFLPDFKAEFIDNSQHLTSDAYCRIHHNIDTAILLNELGWIYCRKVRSGSSTSFRKRGRVLLRGSICRRFILHIFHILFSHVFLYLSFFVVPVVTTLTSPTYYM